MEIKYDIEIPPKATTRSEEYDILFNFVQSHHKTMSIEYDTVNAAMSKITAMKRFIKKHEIVNIKVKRIEKTLYFLKDNESNKIPQIK